MKKVWDFAKDLISRFFDDNLVLTGAEVSYFLILSIFPFILFLVTLISYTPIIDYIGNIDLLETLMPESVYQIVQNLINEIIVNRSGIFLSIGFVFAIWASAGGVSAIIRGINKAFDQEETRSYIRISIISLCFTLGLAILVVFSLLFIVFGKFIGIQISQYFEVSGLLGLILGDFRYIITLVIIFLVLLLLYRITPNCKNRMKDLIPGTIFSSVGSVILSIVFAYYANNISNYSKFYGSLGGLIAMLTWVYLSSIVILIGAEINASLIFSKTGRKKQRNRRY